MIQLTFLLAGTRLCVYNLNLNMKIVADQWHGRAPDASTGSPLARNAANLRSPLQPEGCGQELAVALAALRCIKNNLSDWIVCCGYELLAPHVLFSFRRQ